MSKDQSLEDSVAPDGVIVPQDGDAYDTSEETGDDSKSMTFFKGNGERQVDRWRNRRRLAWLAFTSLIVGTILLWFVVPINRVEALSEPIVWFYISMVGIVGAYVGFASIPTNIGKK